MSCRSAEKLICPYCGAQMKNCTKILGSKSVSAMECLCGAKGPTGLGVTNREAEEAARAAALRRYTPPAKPLTREDITQVRYETAAFWIEFVETYKAEAACHWYLWSGLLGYSAHVVGYCEPWLLPMGDYGRTWRCWERKPTDEERSAAEWVSQE